MRPALLGIAIYFAASMAIAHAADAPNLVGTWKSTGEYAGARSGKARAGFADNPTFNPPQRVSLVVEKQDGRALSGYILLPDGGKDPFVGVLKHDGKQVLLSADNGKATIDLEGENAELCWLDDLPNVNVAACDLMGKSP